MIIIELVNVRCSRRFEPLSSLTFQRGFNMIIANSEPKDSETKSLSLTDSVMVGDSVMGGVKIDKQINNDPEAIARAVINAYKMGASDSK